MEKNQAAVEMGRKGGASKSEAKQQASRKNVAKALAARLAKMGVRVASELPERVVEYEEQP